MTARDTRLPSSLLRGLLRVATTFPLLVVAVEILWFALFNVGLYAFEPVPGGSVAALVLALLGAAIPMYGLFRFVQSRGLLETSGQSGGVDSLVDRIEQNPRAYTGGVVVLKTRDEEWQHVVSALIRRAHVVLLDVTDLSAHVLWELRTALQHKRPESLILLRGTATGPCEPAERRSIPGLSVDEAATLNRSKWVEYPSYTDRRHRGAMFGTVPVLEQAIGDAIAMNPAAGLPEYASMHRLAVAVACVALAGTVVEVSHQLSRPSEAAVRLLTLNACGAPASLMNASSEPLPAQPGEYLAASLRHSLALHASGAHQEAVTELLPPSGDAENPWLLLARGRAFLEAGECDCRTPSIVLVGIGGEFTVNGKPTPAPWLAARLGTLTAPTAKRRIAFIAPAPGASASDIVPAVAAVSKANFVVAFAPQPVERLTQLCGALVPPAGKDVQHDRRP